MTARFVPLAQWLREHGREMPIGTVLHTAHLEARARRRQGRITDYDCDVCSDAGYISLPERRDGRTIEHLSPCPMGCAAGRVWSDSAHDLSAELRDNE